MRFAALIPFALFLFACEPTTGTSSTPSPSSSSASGTKPTSSTLPSATVSATTTAVTASAPIRPGVLAKLSRTSCYGYCPTYELTIHEDGRVEYVGGQHVKTKGKASGTLGAAKLEALRAAFRAADYFALGDYPGDWKTDPTDNASAEVYYAEGGRAKVVRHYQASQSAPPSVAKLEKAIDAIVDVERWIGTDAERMELAKNR